MPPLSVVRLLMLQNGAPEQALELEQALKLEQTPVTNILFWAKSFYSIC